MELRFKGKGVLEIDEARIVYRNFEGRGDKFNREGDRNFAVVIPNREIADKLCNDVNRFGVGWNVKIKEPREEGGDEFIYLPVKVKFNDRGPAIYLETNGVRNRLDEESIDILDNIDISSVSLDIRPYDDEVNGRPFRAAYLQSMLVVQNVDRFAPRFEVGEEY
jgi:hypothetical protein